MEWVRTRKVLTFILLVAGILLMAGVLQAQQQDTRLDLKTTAEKEVKVRKDGTETMKRIPLDKAGPGDIVVYAITYRNVGKSAAVEAAIINPVPRGVVYLADTAEGRDTDITYSIDNGRSWHKPPIMVQIKKPDGSLESTPAPTDRYTHIRWIVKTPVMPGQSGRVGFKVTVKQ